MSKTFLVRHATYQDRRLTPEGTQQAESAATILRGHGLGATALLLTSDTPRSVLTATIIAQGLGIGDVLRSESLREAGNAPELVASLDELLRANLAQHGYNEPPDGGLVIVTHAPLLGIVKNHNPYEPIRNGEVVMYNPSTWDNPDYVPDLPETIAFERALGLQGSVRQAGS